MIYVSVYVSIWNVQYTRVKERAEFLEGNCEYDYYLGVYCCLCIYFLRRTTNCASVHDDE